MSAICPHAALELIPRIARPGAVEPGYSSPCQLIDRALFDELGGLDEGFVVV